MATDNSSDLSAFIQFANAQLAADKNLSLTEALDKWEVHRLEVSQDSDEIEALVQEALDDIAAGDKGIPIEEVFAELEAEFGLKPTAKKS